ncbi:hypothetical protein POM88_016543 [Heracleum sosnowskyi]|uniref:Uncharacterized protein n=1 Tax=Heracleum sosnowskyi TaxID=360622 RepID=A0AAD8MT24_9APIA|nr:hypothetical protein POM88_016543 [Heracleum sosnowskyi]
MADSTKQESSSSSNQAITINPTELSKEECNSTINEMSTELYHLRVTLKSLTKEHTRIKDSNPFLSDRNAVLESQFIEFEKMRNVVTNIIKVQVMETFCKETWNKEKKKLDIVVEDLGAADASMDSDHPLKDYS